MPEYGFEHFGISVTSLDRSVTWYETNFGFTLVKEFEKEEFCIKGASLQLGNDFLEVLEPYSPDAAAGSGTDLVTQLQRTGANHLALQVDDVKAAFEELSRNGVPLVTDLIDNRYFFCLDPDETLIEVRQKK